MSLASFLITLDPEQNILVIRLNLQGIVKFFFMKTLNFRYEFTCVQGGPWNSKDICNGVKLEKLEEK